MGIPIVQLHEKLAQRSGESSNCRAGSGRWWWRLSSCCLLNRLHELTVEIVDRVFNRQFHTVRRQLEEASEAIVHAKTLEEIDHLLVESAVRTLGLSSGAVFRNEGSVLRRLHDTKGWNASMKKELRPEVGCGRTAQPGGWRAGPAGPSWDSLELPTGLEAPCLAVPVRSEIPEATAVVLFGPHETGNDIDEDEREVLDQLAVRAAAGYERVITVLLRQEVAQLKAQLAALQYGNRTELADS